MTTTPQTTCERWTPAERIVNEAQRLADELGRGDRDGARETVAVLQAKLAELAAELGGGK